MSLVQDLWHVPRKGKVVFGTLSVESEMGLSSKIFQAPIHAPGS